MLVPQPGQRTGAKTRAPARATSTPQVGQGYWFAEGKEAQPNAAHRSASSARRPELHRELAGELMRIPGRAAPPAKAS